MALISQSITVAADDSAEWARVKVAVLEPQAAGMTVTLDEQAMTAVLTGSASQAV